MRDKGISKALRRYVERTAGPFGQDIHLAFEGGVVMLDGRVASATHARAIADLVEVQDGVCAIIDRLQVTAAGPSAPPAT